MRIAAYEKWLDEGWSFWRISYGSIALVATGVAAYGYVTTRHHPGSVWWVVTGVGMIAVWATGEMLRWRIRYRRLLRNQQAAAAAPAPEQPARMSPARKAAILRAAHDGYEAERARKLRELVGKGQTLKAAIGAVDHPRRILPLNMPAAMAKWEAEVSELLRMQPDKLAAFQNVPDLTPFDARCEDGYKRISHQIDVLKSALE